MEHPRWDARVFWGRWDLGSVGGVSAGWGLRGASSGDPEMHGGIVGPGFYFGGAFNGQVPRQIAYLS